MATRRAARERALGLAYECELRGVSAARAARRAAGRARRVRVPLVLGVDEHREEIDALIRKFSEHWSLERMPVVDRALLRLGTYELGWVPEVPTAVRHHRGGRAREAVLHEGLRAVRQRAARAHRRGRPPGGRDARVASDELARHRRRSSFPTPSRSCSATTDARPDVPWVVIVWNDPVNLMDYVIVRVPEAVRLLAGEGAAS